MKSPLCCGRNAPYQVRLPSVFVFAFLIAIAGACQPVSAAPTLFGIDSVVLNTSAGIWGAFNDESLRLNDDRIELLVEPSDFTSWPGTVTGGITLPIGDIRLGLEDYQLEVPIRVLPDNEAERIVVTLGEQGAPQTGENYQYEIRLADLEVDEWTTVSRPLSDFSGVATQGGDGEPNDGFATLQLHAPFQSVDTINVEVGGVYVKPIPTDENIDVAFRLDGNTFTGGYDFGTYSVPNAVVNQRDSILIDATPGGGLGIRTTKTSFDPTTHDIVIRARLGADNQAEQFHLNLKDNDGITSRSDVTAEEWLYELQTESFSSDEFSEVRVPASFFSFRWTSNGDVQEGNSEPDFGLHQLQVHSLRNRPGRLQLELESIEIVDRGSPLADGDFDGDSTLTSRDIDRLAAAVAVGPAPVLFDLNADLVVDAADVSFWITDLKNSFLGDANLDGEFSSSDFVQVFITGKYENGEAASWSEGDWNSDGVFSSTDFVVAFIDGGYEQGVRPARSVPEPERVLWSLILFCAFAHRANQPSSRG